LVERREEGFPPFCFGEIFSRQFPNIEDLVDSSKKTMDDDNLLYDTSPR
jgi:hypothetical protein